jgi:hypothetical protein
MRLAVVILVSAVGVGQTSAGSAPLPDLNRSDGECLEVKSLM